MTNQLLFRLEETKMEKLMLSEARPGTTYSVLEIKDEARLINRLSSMGILCGSRLEMQTLFLSWPTLHS